MGLFGSTGTPLSRPKSIWHWCWATSKALADNGHAPLVRVHSECLTGDALGSWRCDCGEQLDAAMRAIGQEGLGAVIYLRGHEGRGIGLHAKLHAYALQDTGLDTVDANLRLGLPVDARDYGAAAAILRDLGLRRIRLLSANPAKSAKLSDLGIEVTARLPLAVTEHAENARYLATKRNRMGHDNGHDLPDVWSELLHGRVPQRAVAGSEAVLLDRYGSIGSRGPRDDHRSAGAEQRRVHRLPDWRRQLRLWRRGPGAPAPATCPGGRRGRRCPDSRRRRSAAHHPRRIRTVARSGDHRSAGADPSRGSGAHRWKCQDPVVCGRPNAVLPPVWHHMLILFRLR